MIIKIFLFCFDLSFDFGFDFGLNFGFGLGIDCDFDLVIDLDIDFDFTSDNFSFCFRSFFIKIMLLSFFNFLFFSYSSLRILFNSSCERFFKFTELIFYIK